MRKIGKLIEAIGDKLGEVLGGLLPQPQPELIPIPVRRPQRPQQR